MSKLPISIVILTLNEADTIGGCLSSVIGHFSEVIVLDSLSTDQTCDLATAAGARVEERPFDNYAAQRDFALNTLEKDNDWVFFLDADERLEGDVIAELQNLVTSGAFEKHSLFRLRRKDHFMGRWLRRTSGYPTWFGRLCKAGSVTVEREINEEYVTDGPVGFLDSHIQHFPFMKGLHHWFERHNRYSTMEAQKLNQNTVGARWRELFHRDPAHRRVVLKKIFYSLPARPVVAFLYLFIFRLGFLDGYPGFVFCLLRSHYEFMISVKRRELRAKGS